MILGETLAAQVADKRLLIFDFDGTLVDSAPLHARAFSEALAPLGISVDYPSIAGLRTDAAMWQILLQAGLLVPEERIAELVRNKQSLARAFMASELRTFPGVDAFLRAVRPTHRLALVSSGSRATIEPALTRLGYKGWFDPIICGDDVAMAKPDPEGFLAALTQTGISAEAALVFEDSPPGFAAARAAGIASVDAVPLFAVT